jgi:short-subunit dehydrogenase
MNYQYCGQAVAGCIFVLSHLHKITTKLMLPMVLLMILRSLRRSKAATVQQHNYTLITGASSGLGRVLAFACARRGFNLVLVSLPGEGLEAVAAYLRRRYGVVVHTYEIDLTRQSAVYELHDWLARKAITVGILINNAGIGGTCAFDTAPPDYLERIIGLNIRALALLTRLLAPQLAACRQAHILNVSSVAAFAPIPFKTVYPASKAFVYAFSLALRHELRHTPVRVSVLHPGPMATNTDVNSRLGTHGIMARWSTLSTGQVAEIALRGMLDGKAVIVPGLINKISRGLMAILPHAITLPLMARIFSKEIKNTTDHETGTDYRSEWLAG